MGLATGGLQSAGANTAGASTTALKYTSTQISGADGFAVTTSGARFRFGTTASSFLSEVAGLMTFGGFLEIAVQGGTSFRIAQGDTMSFAGNAGTACSLRNSGTAMVMGGNLPFTCASDLNQNLGATAVRWSNVFAAALNLGISGALTHSATAPTVVAGAGAVVTAGGACAFDIDLGGAAQTGTITLPTATTGWVLTMHDVTTPASFVFGQTGGNTTTATFTCYSRTTGVATNWNANDHLRCTAVAY